MSLYESEIAEKKSLWQKLYAIGKMKGDYHYYSLERLREIVGRCYESEIKIRYVNNGNTETIVVDEIGMAAVGNYISGEEAIYTEMLDAIWVIWDYIPVPHEATIIYKRGIQTHMWHFAPLPSRFKFDNSCGQVYYAAPYTYLSGDSKDFSKWGFYRDDGIRIYQVIKIRDGDKDDPMWSPM